MKVKSIKLSELLKGNKRLCLSAKRTLNRCFDCKNYGGYTAFLTGKPDKPYFVKPCESRIENTKYDRLIKQKEKQQQTIKTIHKQIKEL